MTLALFDVPAPPAPTTRTPLPDFSSLGCVTQGDHASWAVFSEDRMYRYMLARMWDDYFQVATGLDAEPTRPLMVFGMCNPSKAGASEDDPTIRKCLGFARRYHCGGILVVNAAAHIATDPRELRHAVDPVGPHNATMIHRAFRSSLLTMRIGAWGRLEPQVSRRLLSSLFALKQHDLWCFGTTKDGEPRHPLMLAYDTPLVHLATGRAW